MAYDYKRHHGGLLISSPLISVHGKGHIQVYDEIGNLIREARR